MTVLFVYLLIAESFNQDVGVKLEESAKNTLKTTDLHCPKKS